jgi:uncharacterized protein Smg (DUF494 family)
MIEEFRYTLKEREKVIQRIIEIQKKCFIPMHVDDVDEIKRHTKDDVGLLRYLRMHEIMETERV